MVRMGHRGLGIRRRKDINRLMQVESYWGFGHKELSTQTATENEIGDLDMKKEGKKLAKDYRVQSEKGFRLKDFDPEDTGDWKSKEHADEALQRGIQRTAELQDMLYAQDRWAVLLIFQAMDAAGKDGIIKHVM